MRVRGFRSDCLWAWYRFLRMFLRGGIEIKVVVVGGVSAGGARRRNIGGR